MILTDFELVMSLRTGNVLGTSGFHTGFFSREGTFVCGKVDQLWP